MFARFDENQAMTLRVIKETKRYGRTDGQRENSIPPTNKVCGGYNNNNNSLYLQRVTHIDYCNLPSGVGHLREILTGSIGYKKELVKSFWTISMKIFLTAWKNL